MRNNSAYLHIFVCFFIVYSMLVFVTYWHHSFEIFKRSRWYVVERILSLSAKAFWNRKRSSRIWHFISWWRRSAALLMLHERVRWLNRRLLEACSALCTCWTSAAYTNSGIVRFRELTVVILLVIYGIRYIVIISFSILHTIC